MAGHWAHSSDLPQICIFQMKPKILRNNLITEINVIIDLLGHQSQYHQLWRKETFWGHKPGDTTKMCIWSQRLWTCDEAKIAWMG